MKLTLLSIGLVVLGIWTVSSVGQAGVDKGGASQITGHLSSEDVERLKAIVAKGWKLEDPLVTSYAVLAHATLGIPVPNAADVCKNLLAGLDASDGTKYEVIFALTSAIPKVPSCKLAPLKPAVKSALEQLVKQGGNSQDIFYASESLRNSGVTVDATKLDEVLKASIKADDSAQSLGYALIATSSGAKSLKKVEIWDRVEDVIAQADEVDKTYLQFEGGLSVTGPVLVGIVRLAEALNKQFPLTADQLIKFGNYLVSRRTVTTPRGAFLLVSALDTISKNKFLKPVFIGTIGSNVISESTKVLSIRASDLLGRPLDVTVQLESLVANDQTKVSGVEFIQAVQSTTDKSLFTLDLKGKTIPKGFYNAIFLAKSAKNDKTLILQPTTVPIKVIGKLGTVTSRVGVSESDQQAKIKWNDLNKGQKLQTKLDLDANQKFIVKVAASEVLHQVFVVFKCKTTQREVAFIAQPETEGKTDYKLELDMTTNAKDFGFNSGSYEVVLYLGDFLIEDSFAWSLGDVNLHVAAGKAKSVNPLYAVSYGPKPEIKHMFRQPEPRPPRLVSDAFTAVALAPLLVLFVLWIRVGANISAFPFSLSALAFHLGLGGMFGVYGLFWLKLTMFEALKWMTIPAIVTFIAGHRLLASISEKRKA